MFPRLTVDRKVDQAGYHDVRLNGVIIGFLGKDNGQAFLAVHSDASFSNGTHVTTIGHNQPVKRAVCVTLPEELS